MIQVLALCQSKICSEGLTLKNISLDTLYGGQFTLSTQLITPNYPIILSH